MAKETIRPEKYSLKQIQKSLKENNECYVLITCGSASKEGKMEVEMSYDGDEDLAAYLVDNAQQVFNARLQTDKAH